MKTARAEILTQCGGEQWVINKAVHYNDWASFTKAEFRAVVEAFKVLLLQFRCQKAGCESWLLCHAKEGRSGSPSLPLHEHQSESETEIDWQSHLVRGDDDPKVDTDGFKVALPASDLVGLGGAKLEKVLRSLRLANQVHGRAPARMKRRLVASHDIISK